MIHIVDAALAAARAAGHRRLGAHRDAIRHAVAALSDRFGPAGIEIVVPPDADQGLVHGIYMGELVPGVLRDESRGRLVDVIARLRDEQGVDGVILGGTELALILDRALVCRRRRSWIRRAPTSRPPSTGSWAARSDPAPDAGQAGTA